MPDANKIIYFDHAATTSPTPEVVSLYSKVATEYFANPSSSHRLGVDSARLFEKAKLDILNSFGLKNHDIIFTSGATEANNLAIKGYMERYSGRGKHIIISNIEHPSIMNTVNHLALKGYDVSIVSCRKDGRVYLEDVQNEIKENTILISIMGVNNETGIIQDIARIASFIKLFHNIALHVDAVQAVGKVDLPYNDIDLITVSMHKLGGLKGSGLLIKRKAIELSPILDGGGQQNSFRSGTLDLANAVIDSVVIKQNLSTPKSNKEYVANLIEPIYKYFEANPNEIVINSTRENPYIINISLKNKKASVFAEFLSNNNIMVSTHSACSSKLDNGSPTLTAMGRSAQLSKNSIRLSFSKDNTKEEIDRFIEVFDYALKRIRG